MVGIMVRISATDASRNFSGLLNRVAAGDEIELVRNGSPVAVIRPARERLVEPGDLLDLISSGPQLDRGFAADVDAARDELGPPQDRWRS